MLTKIWKFSEPKELCKWWNKKLFWFWWTVESNRLQMYGREGIGDSNMFMERLSLEYTLTLRFNVWNLVLKKLIPKWWEHILIYVLKDWSEFTNVNIVLD